MPDRFAPPREQQKKEAERGKPPGAESGTPRRDDLGDRDPGNVDPEHMGQKKEQTPLGPTTREPQ